MRTAPEIVLTAREEKAFTSCRARIVVGVAEQR
jgi:hypothetical protein